MTDLPDWAKDRAREWYQGGQEDFRYEGPLDGSGFDSLAALLVEVDRIAASRIITESEWQKVTRARVLAEVRRVVEDEIEMTRGTYWVSKSGTHLGDGSAPLASILSRLDAL